MLALMRKTFWSHFWSEKSNNNLVYCPSSPPFNDHAAVAPTSVRGIPNGPPKTRSCLAKMTVLRIYLSIFCLGQKIDCFVAHLFQLNFWGRQRRFVATFNSCKTFKFKSSTVAKKYVRKAFLCVHGLENCKHALTSEV